MIGRARDWVGGRTSEGMRGRRGCTEWGGRGVGGGGAWGGGGGGGGGLGRRRLGAGREEPQAQNQRDSGPAQAMTEPPARRVSRPLVHFEPFRGPEYFGFGGAGQAGAGSSRVVASPDAARG